MTHTHTPQINPQGYTIYICKCGARKGKSQMVNGEKVEVWEVESQADEAARKHAIEMLQTEGYGYDCNKQDANDPLDSHDPRNQD